MRVGVSSRGNAWASMGCLGWLFIGPFILAGLVLIVAVQVLAALCVGLYRGGVAVSAARRQRQRRAMTVR